MGKHLEVVGAEDAQFDIVNDLEKELDEQDCPPGWRGLVVTSNGDDGVALVGSLQEIREFVRLVLRGLDLEIEKEAGT